MSLQPRPVEPVPELTTRVAKAAFPKGNSYLTLRDHLGVLFQDESFASLFPRRGQPAETPWRLALVTIMQFAEDLSDVQAADAVRSRIDWKYALSWNLKILALTSRYCVSFAPACSKAMLKNSCWIPCLPGAERRNC